MLLPVRVGCFASSLCFISLLCADSKTVIKITAGGNESIRTSYVQGDKYREDFITSGRQVTTISVPPAAYQLDTKRREYIEYKPLDRSRGVARHGISVSFGFGKSVDIYFETVDTGERQQFFGKTAAHLILRRRDVPETSACGQETTTQREGWYLPGPQHGAGAFLTGGSCQMRFHARPPNVVPVVEESNHVKTEMTELSEAPLDPALFEVPAGFRKVDSLQGQEISWEQRWLWEWDALVRQFESWF